MNRIYASFLAGWFLIAAYAQQPQRGGDYPSDPVYIQAITKGNSTFSCYLSYPLASSKVIPAHGNNSDQLTKLETFLIDAITHNHVCIRQVTLKGYSSIEGSYHTNYNLSLNRASSLKNYLILNGTIPTQVQLSAVAVGEDWNTLRYLVQESNLRERSEIIQIIDRVPAYHEREMLLKKLNGGSVYTRLEKEFFPYLRRVDVQVQYDLHRMMEQKAGHTLSEQQASRQLDMERKRLLNQQDCLEASIPVTKKSQNPCDPCNPCTQTNPCDPCNPCRQANPCGPCNPCGAQKVEQTKQKKVRNRKPAIKPIIGIKTNMLSWAGITPEFERKTYMPNLAGEYFFKDRWSIEVSATYSYWNYDNNQKFWGLSAYSIEPRFWMWPGATYKWIFAGAYAQVGDFDIQEETTIPNQPANYTGKYWSAGLSMGCYFPLGRRIGIEAGLRAGYRNEDTKVYEIEDEHNYYYRSAPEKKWALTGVYVNLAYRFGK